METCHVPPPPFFPYMCAHLRTQSPAPIPFHLKRYECYFGGEAEEVGERDRGEKLEKGTNPEKPVHLSTSTWYVNHIMHFNRTASVASKQGNKKICF